MKNIKVEVLNYPPKLSDDGISKYPVVRALNLICGEFES